MGYEQDLANAGLTSRKCYARCMLYTHVLLLADHVIRLGRRAMLRLAIEGWLKLRSGDNISLNE